ncbi:MAG: signal peptidase I [Ruminococcus sp.]|nr:signal peptidase I [Oscillospiraceae bacterium]MDY4414206.1 signal peptidase I [Ruminococcus sp.]
MKDENNMEVQENAEKSSENENKGNSEKKGKKLLRDIIDIAESTAITMFIVILLFTYILHPVNVVGTSMVPTLQDEDKVFMTTIIPDISYGDIIVIDNDKAYLLDENDEVVSRDSYQLNECIIKRVIAEGGQTVDIDFSTGNVTVDGNILDEPYINAPTLTDEGAFDFPITVPEGYYFVMGDNRNASSDSRHPYVGFIKKSQIYGKAIIRYAPFENFKIL